MFALLPASRVLELTSPRDTKHWTPSRVSGIEHFTAPNGLEYVRCAPNEAPDVVVSFARTPGLAAMHLRLAEQSRVVRRIERRQRKQNRELKRRGYDVA